MDNQILLEIKDICKSFASTRAVDCITLKIPKGEVRGLIGENGSGKSTLVSMISGIQQADSGLMKIEGELYSPDNLIAANKKGVSIIVQEMNTLEGLTVAENLFFGNEDQFVRKGIRNIKAMNEKAGEYLSAFGLEKIEAAADISRYNYEERKLLELLKAVYFNPKLLIVDETTTALSHKGREQLYRVINTLHGMGSSIIFISHDLQEVLNLCDMITILRDGQYIDTVSKKDVEEKRLKQLMVGRELKENYYREDYGTSLSDQIVLEVNDIQLPGWHEKVNFKLHKGEILGIGGLSESGMHQLGKVLFGVFPQSEGSVRLLDKNLKIESMKQAILNGIAYVSKNRDQEALLVNSPIVDNVCISMMDILKRGIFISPKRERELALNEVKKLKLKMDSLDQFVSELSGGNKQKVALTKWLGRGSDIFILDSPTRGIDVMVKAAIYQLMADLKEEGKSIIMISEELLELIGMCDRLLVIKNGQISTEILRHEGLTEEEVINFMI